MIVHIGVHIGVHIDVTTTGVHRPCTAVYNRGKQPQSLGRGYSNIQASTCFAYLNVICSCCQSRNGIVFIRVIYGTRVSLSVGVIAAIMVLIIGLVYGSVAGYFGGKVDLIMMRIVDIVYSLPDMLIIILLSVVFQERLKPLIEGTMFEKLGTNMISMFIVFGLLYWVSMARLIRGQILTIKNNEYVLAARCIGTRNSRILTRHILPNCLSVIIITTALQVPSAIFTESYLSFLGLGVSAPLTSLGSLANDARSAMQSYPYRLVIPAVLICLIVLALNLLGDGLRDAFDSKLN